jgi:hypothetical protein
MRAPLGHPEAGAGRPVARRCPSSGPTGRHRLDHLRRREQAPELSSILEPDGAPTALGPRSGRRPPHPRGVSSRVESGSSAARARRSRPWSPRRRAWRRGAPGPGPTTVPSSMPAPRSRALDGAPPNPNRLGTVPCSVSGSGRRRRSSRGAGCVVGAPSLLPHDGASRDPRDCSPRRRLDASFGPPGGRVGRRCDRSVPPPREPLWPPRQRGRAEPRES